VRLRFRTLGWNVLFMIGLANIKLRAKNTGFKNLGAKLY
jgi:hypothetical protein